MKNINFRKNYCRCKKRFINYLRLIYSKKRIIIKLTIFAITFLIINLISFLIRDYILKSKNIKNDFLGNFLIINITNNTGAGFSMFDSNQTFVYFIKWFICIFTLILLIFSNNFFLDLATSMIFAGGMANIIDKYIPDTYEHLFNNYVFIDSVVDYLQFPFINSAIFNFQDVFIVFGTIIYVIVLFVIIFRKYCLVKNEEDYNEKKI